MTSVGCRRRRAMLALESALAPVVHGAIAAALTASMLATSEFGFVARLFLRLLLALVVLGLVDGLLFFPIILALIGPRAEVWIILLLATRHFNCFLLIGYKV